MRMATHPLEFEMYYSPLIAVRTYAAEAAARPPALLAPMGFRFPGERVRTCRGLLRDNPPMLRDNHLLRHCRRGRVGRSLRSLSLNR